ncbi:MAG TPA: hypothetical protein VGI47_03105, partial [Candidatus Binataceae bacterium]
MITVSKEDVPPHLNFAPMQNAADSLARSAEHYRQALSHKLSAQSGDQIDDQTELLRTLNQRLIES